MDFFEYSSSQVELSLVIEAFRKHILTFGFEASACGAWTGVGKSRVSRFYFVDWPKALLERYAASKMIDRDLVVTESQRRMMPFTWKQAMGARAADDYFLDSYRFAQEFGFVDGLAVPVHGPAGYMGAVSLVSRALVQLKPAELAMLHAMCLHIHERCRIEARDDQPVPKLTRREIEVMQWAAAGKSDAEIGQLVGIAAATAHYHAEKVKKKLGVKSRVQAVSQLVLRGQI